MTDVAINKGDKNGRSQESGRSTTLQQRGEEGGLSRRAPSSLFSLAPRDFFAASPFELIRRFTDEMDRFFPTSAQAGSSMMTWAPAIEIAEKEGEFVVSAELPGLKKDDVKVELMQDTLVLRGERKQQQEERRGGVYRTERSYGSFIRTIPIPEEAQVEQAKATFEDGILTVSVPVAQAASRRREIPIEDRGSSGPGEPGEQKTQHGESKAA